MITNLQQKWVLLQSVKGVISVHDYLFCRHQHWGSLHSVTRKLDLDQTSMAHKRTERQMWWNSLFSQASWLFTPIVSLRGMERQKTYSLHKEPIGCIIPPSTPPPHPQPNPIFGPQWGGGGGGGGGGGEIKIKKKIKGDKVCEFRIQTSPQRCQNKFFQRYYVHLSRKTISISYFIQLWAYEVHLLPELSWYRRVHLFLRNLM